MSKVDFKNRKVWIASSDITMETFKEFCKDMHKFECSNIKSPILISLSCTGGDDSAGLAFYSKIRNSPCYTYAHVYGAAHSAASIILAAGSYRTMSPEASVLIHDSEQDYCGMKGKVLKNEKKKAEDMEQQWATILSKHTKLSKQEWRKLSKESTYLSAKDCLKVGLIHEIKGE